MAKSKLQLYFTDRNGNALSQASVSIKIADTSTNASTWTDRAGTIAGDNPIFTDSDGEISLYIAPGRYDITATKSGASQTINDYIVVDENTIFESFVNVRSYGAIADFNPSTGTGTDNWQAFKDAIATGRNVYVPAGDIINSTTGLRYGYRIATKELLLKTKGQILFGDGMGSSYGSEQAKDHISVSGLYFTGTGQTYIHTRRKARAVVGDPQDDAISTAINIENEGIEVRDLSVNLYCDYTNTSASNLGDDWDVGIFIGCVPQVKLTNVRVIGYFRVASVYLDGTRAFNLPELVDADGVAYPTASYQGGFDQNYFTNVFTAGGHKGLFIAGPIYNTANYYDQQQGLVTDVRGRAGGADFHSLNCNFFGPDHHSLQRRVDPLGPLNFANENLETLACGLAINAAGQTDSSQPVRRLMFSNCRVQTFEMVRIAIRNGQEVYFRNLHTEPFPTFTVKNTSGVVIDHDDTTTHDYGSIAVKAITNDATLNRGIFIDGINFRVPETTWFDDILTAAGFQITNIYTSSKTTGVANKFDRSAFHEDVTINDDLSVVGNVSVTGNSTLIGNVVIQSEDAGASEGPLLELYRNSATPAASDIIGSLRYTGEDSAGVTTVYASIRGSILDTTDTSEDAEINILTRNAGTTSTRVVIGQGLRVGSPTGGDKGAGTGNFTGLYINDVSVDHTLGTTQNSTSGTSISFTGIPSGVKSIIVQFEGFSTSGTAVPKIRLGDGGGIEATGYVASGATFANGASPVVDGASTGGFLLSGNWAAANTYSGAAILSLMDSSTNTWTCISSGADSAAESMYSGTGTKSLSAVLTQLQIISDGVDTMDAGRINISYSR